MGFLSEYNAKLTSADNAVKCVKSGDWVEYTSNLGFPALCDAALAKRRDELRGVKIRGDLIFGPVQVIECDPDMEHFVYNTWHCSGYERRMCDKGRAFFEPMVFRNLAWYYKNFLTSDVCMVTVSGMDDEGYFYFGPSLGMSKCIADNSKIVIVEVNRNIPRIKGSEDARIHISEIDHIVETGDPQLFEMPNPAPTETDVKTANLLLPYIENGSCIQLGIGGMPNALGELIADSELKDLGMHTELCSDGYLAMFKAGKLTNAKKEFDTGLSTWNLAMGSQEFYDWIAENPKLFHPADLDYVHDPQRIGTMKNVISINGGVQLDLMGQENAESAGTRQLSGIGGQMDFLEGAYRSVGGKGYICINSARKAKDGTLKSNIVPFIPGGSTVSAPRTMIQSVATEYGIANLSGKTLRERAEAMIAIAHPDFRDELEQYAKEAFH